MIQKCEERLDRVARENGIVIRLNGVIIQPRPMGYIQAHIKLNTIKQ